MSLISTYQSRKSLFAEKLEDKGVEASATDGLTTLINKIDDIEGGFTEGLLIYAENNIVQKEDTVDLYALLLQDGKPVPNKTVEFVGLYTVISGKVCHVPSHYRFEKLGHLNATVYLDANHHFKIGSGALFYKDDVEQSSAKVYSVEVNQNTLTVVYMGGTTSTFDVSNYDMSVIESTENIYDIICYASGTTGSDGVASYTYTGVGEGLREVYAKYGTLVSETYEIWDTFTYDTGINGTANEIWDTYQCTLNRGEEYSEVTETTEYGFIRIKQANSIPKNCTIEFDYFNVDGALNRGVMQLQTTANAYITLITLGYLGNLPVGAWHHIKIKIDGGVMTVTNNTNTTVYTANLTIATDNILFLFITNNETTKFRFKNFKAYGV